MIGDGDLFWLLTGASALLVVGGGLAMALVRGAADEEERDRPR